MTPIIFITFLVSLAVVDYRNSAKRSHYHAEGGSSWLPQWLHRILYRVRPYQYVTVDEKDQVVRGEVAGRPFYHSKQRKLMKMEVAEAFEMRGWAVLVLALASVVIALGLWEVVSWGLSFLL